MAKEVKSKPHRKNLPAYNKKRMRFGAFIRKYGRIIIGCTILLAIALISILAPKLTPYDPLRNTIYKMLPAGSIDKEGFYHVLGTDSWGRDMLTQLMYGARVAILVPVAVQALACIMGTILGMICGYYKKADFVISRIMEAFHAIPTLVLCMLICELLGKGTFQLILSLAIDGTIGVARMIRGQVLSIRQEEYIECEKVIGASDFRTLIKHVLPALYNTLIVRFTTGLSGTLLSMVGLAFVSVGLNIQIPNWGLQVALGRGNFILQPYLTLYPAICIIVTTFAFCLIGDGMRSVIGSGRS